MFVTNVLNILLIHAGVVVISEIDEGEERERERRRKKKALCLISIDNV